jgi:hypothetical protein
MFTVKVDTQVIDYCRILVQNYDFGHRYTANGNKEQQLTGIIGQSVIMNLFHMGYVEGASGFDNGIDLIYENKTIDVKTMGRTTDVKRSYTNNFLKLQDYYKTDIYIFCSYHKINHELTVCGWISKADFILKRRFYPKGSIRIRSDNTKFETFSDLFEIDNSHLNDVKDIIDLKSQLSKLSSI